jgi:hypothetical protein
MKPTTAAPGRLSLIRSRPAILAAIGAIVVLGGLIYWLSFPRSAEAGDQYFYDVSEKKLFRAPRDAFAPIAGVGGASNDAVEAVVVFCESCGESKQRIAYLRTHTPEYKAKREAARREGKLIEDLTRQYIEENTLVRELDGDWVAAATPAGRKIVSGWKRTCPIHGAWETFARP